MFQTSYLFFISITVSMKSKSKFRRIKFTFTGALERNIRNTSAVLRNENGNENKVELPEFSRRHVEKIDVAEVKSKKLSMRNLNYASRFQFSYNSTQLKSHEKMRKPGKNYFTNKLKHRATVLAVVVLLPQQHPPTVGHCLIFVLFGSGVTSRCLAHLLPLHTAWTSTTER